MNYRARASLVAALASALLATGIGAQELSSVPEDPFVIYEGQSGPLHPKRVVFLTGDEEYRSEESMPQLAQQLARLGATCIVLFAIDRESGTIDPAVRDHIAGLEALENADLMVIFLRRRDLPDEEMQHVARYVESGRPIVGLRTATHAFELSKGSKFERYSSSSTTWKGGFGRQVLGETFLAHHGGHGTQSTRGVIAPDATEHPILRGIDARTVWDPADVYAVRLPLPSDCTPLLLGEVLAGMKPDDEPAPPRIDAKTEKTVDLNEPMMPIAWTRLWRTPTGSEARVFTTTIGSAEAFLHEGTRRLLVQACCWALGAEAAIEAEIDVALIGDYKPSPFGFGKHRRGVKPADLK